MVAPDLIEILRCPATMQKVRLLTIGELAAINEKREKPLSAGLIREDGRLVFPIEDDIPVMLLDEAVVVG